MPGRGLCVAGSSAALIIILLMTGGSAVLSRVLFSPLWKYLNIFFLISGLGSTRVHCAYSVHHLNVCFDPCGSPLLFFLCVYIHGDPPSQGLYTFFCFRW